MGIFTKIKRILFRKSLENQEFLEKLNDAKRKGLKEIKHNGKTFPILKDKFKGVKRRQLKKNITKTKEDTNERGFTDDDVTKISKKLKVEPNDARIGEMLEIMSSEEYKSLLKSGKTLDEESFNEIKDKIGYRKALDYLDEVKRSLSNALN